MEIPKRLAIDFDGCICENVFPEIGHIKPGAKQAISALRALGYQILIWSCRSCHWDYDVYGGNPSQPTMQRDRVRDMIAFLETNGIEYDEIDDGSKGKPGADAYIDDKAIRFSDNWDDIAMVFTKLNGKVYPKMGKLIPFPVKSVPTVADATGDSTDPDETPEGPFYA